MTPDDRAPDEALCTFGIPLSPKTTDHPDAPLIALEQERADLQAQANARDGDEEANAIQDRVSVLEGTIAQLPAHSPVGTAIKLRRLERTFKDKDGAPWDQQNFDTALAALDRLGDVNLIVWEQEYFRLLAREVEIAARGEYPGADADSEANVKKWQEVFNAIRSQPAYTTAGVAAKLRALRYWQTQVADNDDVWWDSCLASLASIGAAQTPGFSAMPICDDTKLFAVAGECDRLHEIWAKSCKAYSDAEGPMFDKRRRGKPVSDAKRAKVSEAEAQEDADKTAYCAIETRLLSTPAHTPQGLAVKLRTFRRYHANTKKLAPVIDGFIADAERASTCGKLDTAPSKTDWLALLEEYRERMKDESAAVRANQNDTDAEHRATDEATEATQSVEHRIAEAEADGLLGLAVKLAVLWNNSIADTGDPNEGDALLVGSALDYLAKQTGIDPYVTYDRDCKPIRTAEIGGGS